MSAPPVFGPTDGRWSLGSAVRAYRWTEEINKDGVMRRIEQFTDGLVVGLTVNPDEDPELQVSWIATVSFGPAFDLVLETRYPVAQIRALEPG